MTGKEFAELLERQGYDFFTGVPCSLLEGLLEVLETHPRLFYVPAAREDAAVGLAAGAWLAGRQPVVLMQNSGLGTSLNALASLALLYKLPSLLLVSWRGYGGADAPEHILMGAISPPLLGLLGIAYRELHAESVEADLHWATQEATRRSEPVALLLPPGVLNAGEISGRSALLYAGDLATSGLPNSARGQEPVRAEGRRPEARVEPGTASRGGPGGLVTPSAKFGPRGAGAPGEGADRLIPTISRADAIRVAIGCLKDEPVIHANGYICRESLAAADRPLNFYMIGSMGLASSIGLGIALAKPEKKVVVFDGDGNLLMNLGSLAMAGGLRPRNFLHIVFDNEVYGSTGGQRSLSREVRLDHLAAASGYRSVAAVFEPGDIEAAVSEGLAREGPGFILVKVTAEEKDTPRIPCPPEAIRDRFSTALRSA
jgi:phosphonopyruvate decarboxylase